MEKFFAGVLVGILVLLSWQYFLPEDDKSSSPVNDTITIQVDTIMEEDTIM